MRRTLRLSTLGLLASTAAWAAPTVIYDSGQTRPLAPYLESLRGEVPPPERRPTPSGEADLAAKDLLPIDTPGMTPGLVQPRALAPTKGIPRRFVASRPLFLIGADTMSRQWLAQNRDRLEAIGAVGMLVQARTLKDLKLIARLAQGLSIMPVPASGIARLYDLRHYPVLIWRGRIEQ